MESAGSSSFVAGIKQEFPTKKIDCSLDEIVRRNQNQLRTQKNFGGGLRDDAKDALRNLNPRFNQRKNFKPNLPSYRIRMKSGALGNGGRQNSSDRSPQVSLMLRGVSFKVYFVFLKKYSLKIIFFFSVGPICTICRFSRSLWRFQRR